MKTAVPEQVVKVCAITDKTGRVFISPMHRGSISNFHSLLFDGVRGRTTYQPEWLEVDSVPTKIEQAVPSRHVNKRFDIKPEFVGIPNLPQTISLSDSVDHGDIIGLYEYKFDVEDAKLVELLYDVITLNECDVEIRKPKYPNIMFSKIDTILLHPLQLHSRSCWISATNSFQIIRNHVKRHIDHRFAKITSDYDFVFAVAKHIRADIERPNKQHDIVVNRVLHIGPKEYQGCDPVTPFCGDNVVDLENKIDEYLSKLMSELNEPLVICPHCKGSGVERNVK